MTEEEMWQAVCDNNADYDGLFFYAVKTTDIYCRPSCKSKRPNRENICFFESTQDAVKAGFQPCKRCRSDLIDYQPMKEIASKIKSMLDEAFKAQSELFGEIKRIGVSQRRMTDIFKDEYGITPKAYADSLRLGEAKRLLAESDMKVIDIAYCVGFGSLPAFYAFFRKETGLTPTAYRRSNKAPAKSDYHFGG